MKRTLYTVSGAVALIAIFWLMILNLDSDPTGADDLNAIILRAPPGFAAQDLGAVSLDQAAAVLSTSPEGQAAARFIEDGDTVILLADRRNDRIVEMRAARTGTIIERHWQGAIDRRLEWAAEHGDLNAPGLSGPTGKNLYH